MHKQITSSWRGGKKKLTAERKSYKAMQPVSYMMDTVDTICTGQIRSETTKTV